MAEGVGDVVENLTTMWVKVPNPKLDGGDGTATWLSGHLWWYMSAVAVLSLLIAGARMAWNTRGAESELRSAAKSLLQLSLVSAGGIALINLALQIGDAYAVWILQDAGGDGFGKRLSVMLAALMATGPLGTILLIVLGLLVIVTAIVQIILMVVRSATLVILAGIWPLSASATNTEWGSQWFKKVTGWIVAMVLYKPAAATVYAAALHMFGNEKGLLGALMGLASMLLAVVALPALMRLCVPLVGGLSEGAGASGGALAGAGVMAASSLGGGSPSGAKSVPQSSGVEPPYAGRSAGGGGGPSGATPGGGGSGPPAAAGGSGAAVGAGGGEQSAGAGATSGGAAAGSGAGAAAGGPAGAAAMAGAQMAGAAASGAKRLAGDATSDAGERNR